MSQPVNANKLTAVTVLMAMNQFYRSILFIAKHNRPRIIKYQCNFIVYIAHEFLTKSSELETFAFTFNIRFVFGRKRERSSSVLI